MTDRLQIEITGELPEDTKFGILADAQTRARALAEALNETHGTTLTATVKSVRPGKKAAPIAQAATLALEPIAMTGTVDVQSLEIVPHGRRHAAG